MNTWTLLFWIGCALIGATGLYALHRLALWLEERGHLYYLHKKPKGGAAGCFVAFQQAIQPEVQHVIHIKEERSLRGDESGAGSPDPDHRGATAAPPSTP